MKYLNKITSILLFTFTIQPIFAQTPGDLSLSGPLNTKKVRDSMKKENRFLGLNGSGAYTNGMINTRGVFSITGQGGYFVANRLIAGIQFTYQTDNLQTKDIGVNLPVDSDVHHRYKYYVPEVFARYYITSFRVKPIAQLSTGWNFQSGSRTDVSGEEKRISSNNFTVGATVGLGWLATKNVSVELLYNKKLSRIDYADGVTKFRIGVSVLVR